MRWRYNQGPKKGLKSLSESELAQKNLSYEELEYHTDKKNRTSIIKVYNNKVFLLDVHVRWDLDLKNKAKSSAHSRAQT